MTKDIQEIRETLEATYPCGHGSSDTWIGDGVTWARCNDCGELFRQVDWPKFRAAGKRHTNALAALAALEERIKRMEEAGDAMKKFMDGRPVGAEHSNAARAWDATKSPETKTEP